MCMLKIWEVIQILEEMMSYRVSNLMKIYWTCDNGIIVNLKKKLDKTN